MKKLLPFLFFAISVNFLFAQNYRLVNPQRSCYFSYFDQEINKITVCGIHIDSAGIAGVDSVFYNYKSLYDLNVSGCNNAIDTGFIGNHFILKSTGETVFLNENNDSIFFLPNANLNDTWILMQLGAGNYLNATITSVATETILGITDSVKTISLQANISNIFNGKKIKVAKIFGIIQTYNLLRFPTDTTTYHLEGITNPDYGIKNINMHDIFNFNVGDTMQLYTEISPSVIEHTYDYQQYNILSKYESANNDTVIYSVENTDYYKYQYNLNINTSFTHDTVQRIYIISVDSVFNKRPLEFIYSPLGYSTLKVNDTLFLSRQKKTFEGFTSFDQINHCIANAGGWCYIPTTVYTEGLGPTYYTLDGGSCGDMHLVYYHKGNEIWGTPFDWTTILAVKENVTDLSFQIQPNPFTDFIKINFADNLKTKGTLNIHNIFGQTIYNANFETQNHFEIPTKEFKKGVYILSLQTENKSYKYKLIKN